MLAAMATCNGVLGCSKNPSTDEATPIKTEQKQRGVETIKGTDHKQGQRSGSKDPPQACNEPSHGQQDRQTKKKRPAAYGDITNPKQDWLHGLGCGGAISSALLGQGFGFCPLNGGHTVVQRLGPSRTYDPQNDGHHGQNTHQTRQLGKVTAMDHLDGVP
jgi:hypothetical protein